MPHPKILAVDDDALFGETLLSEVQRCGCSARRVGTLAKARHSLLDQPPDLVLLDMMLPDGHGMDLMADIRGLPQPPVVVCMSACLDVPAIVTAIQSGASDYLLKTEEPEALIERVHEHARSARQKRLGTCWRKQGLLGQSPAMKPVERLVSLAARTSTTLLLHGETGTGKSHIAKLIHELSGRSKRPFVTVDCAALSESLAESELFGHERGAFTGAVARRMGAVEAAERGTLFFDEIADLPPAIQGKLLRILDERLVRRVGSVRDQPVHARVIGATRRDLAQLVAEGRFREDLYFRLSVLEIRLPPLRHRRQDIPQLADSLMRAHCGRALSECLRDGGIAELLQHDYPGNVRELRNIVERIAIASEGLPVPHTRLASATEAIDARQTRPLAEPSAAVDSLDDDIGKALVAAGGRIGEAARSLGLSRHALRRRLKKLQSEGPAHPGT